MTKLAGVAFCCVALGALPAAAETFTAKCAGKEYDKAYEMTIVYEGEDNGTITISGSFGDMSLPASMKERENTSEDGVTVRATQFWGGGEIPIVVPDKTAIEACVKAKLPPDQVTDADIVFVTIPGCAASVPPTAQPIPVKVYAEVTFLDPETVFVIFKRTYLEATDLPDKEIVLEPMPPPTCTMVQ